MDLFVVHQTNHFPSSVKLVSSFIEILMNGVFFLLFFYETTSSKCARELIDPKLRGDREGDYFFSREAD